MKQLRLPASNTHYDTISLGGGLDLLTPILRLRSGVARDALNWECAITGGYARSKGYERADGQTKPSNATYAVLTCNVTGTLAAGNVITGVTSGATGTVISVTDVTGTTKYVAVTKTTGTFVAGETLNVGGTPRATITTLGGGSSAANWDAIQTALAADVYRALITAVPGSGAVRGGFLLNGVNYAFRDNAGGTALVLYKSSSSGWTLVPFVYEVSFTAGSVAPTVGGAITQGANSATVRAVVLESGSWGGGTAAGRFIVTQPAPGNFVAGALTAGGTATLSGAATAITLLPGGRVETDRGDFGAGIRVYGTDGVNRAWEFDGTTLVPIKTGVTPDTPKHVCVFKDHLFVAFGNVLKHSGITKPYDWSVTAGGAEYRCAGTINALLRQPGNQSVGALSISLDEFTEMLYGTSAADFKHVSFEESAGAVPYCAQRLGGQALYFGAIGVMSLGATQDFGNFEPSSMTMNIRPFTQVRRNQLNASLVNRERSQYRLYFADGYGLALTVVNGKMMGAMPLFFPNKVSVAWKGATPDGEETSYFGSDNGMVYQLDVGTSHDGATLASNITLVFASQGNSRTVKKYRSGEFEMQGDGYCELGVTYEVDYGQADRVQGAATEVALAALSPGSWDGGGSYDSNLYWDGKSLTPSRVLLGGGGVNFALRIDSNSTYFQSVTMNSIMLHWSPRKALKS
jgi:hypothetical protein